MKQAITILFICLFFHSARSQVTEIVNSESRTNFQTALKDANAEIDANAKIPLRSVAFDKNPSAVSARAVEFNNRGAHSFADGNFDEAAGFFRLAVEIAPDLIQLKINLANALLNQENYREAEAICRELIGENVEDDSNYAILGAALYEAGDYAASVVFYQKAIALNEQNPAISNGLGKAFYRLKDFRAARKAFESALKQQPFFPDALNNYGAALIADKQYRKAVEKLRRAVEQRPDFAEAHNNLGVAYCFTGKPKQGRKSFAEAVRLNPQSASAQFHLGMSYLIVDDRKSAGQCLEILRKLDADLAHRFQEEFYRKYVVDVSDAK